MSRLIDKLKADANDPRTSAEITYDIGQQLEAAGRRDLFEQNPDFYQEYLEIKDSLRRPLSQEVGAALSSGFKDALPEAGFNAAAAAYSLLRGGAAKLLGQDKFQGDSVTDWFHSKAQQERDEAEIHRGEVSVPGIEDINDAGDLGRFAAVATADAIPQILPMLAGGLGAAARGVGMFGKLAGAAIPAAIQQTGEVYGGIAPDAQGTLEAGAASVAGGLVAGALDVGGALGGPLGRLLRKANAPEKAIIESVMSKVGAEGLYHAAHNVLNRGGFKGAAASLIEGALTEAPTEWAQEAIAIAAQEYAGGAELPKEVIESRLKNAFAAGGLVGGILGGAVGFKSRQGKSRLNVNDLEEADPEIGQPDPRMNAMTNPPMEFGDLPMTPEEQAAFNTVQEPAPRMEFTKEEPLTPEEFQALYGVQSPAGAMQFETDDEIDMQSFADQALNAAKGAAKLSAPVQVEVDIEADSYVPPKKKLVGDVPILQGPQSFIPDKYDITKPLLGPGNEMYAGDAPSPFNFDQGIFEARRTPENIMTPEETADAMFQFDARRSTQKAFKSRKPEKTTKIIGYHGTHAPAFSTFKAVREHAIQDPHTLETVRNAGGIYFTDSIEGTKNYAEKESGGRVVKAELDIKNPYMATREFAALLTQKRIAELKAKGHDGIIWKRPGAATEIIAFDPSQINILSQDATETGLAGEIKAAKENIAESQKLQAEEEPVIPFAPVIKPDARIENGPPLIGRIYTPEDGGNDAKIKTAAIGGISDPNTPGTHKAVALLDRATGQILVRDIKNQKGRVEHKGPRVATEIVGGMQVMRNRKPVIDPVYATQSAPWERIAQEMHKGLPRYDVVGEFYFDDPRSSVNFNFQNLADFEAHAQLKEALNNFQTRGVGASPEIKARLEKLFPRDTEKFATRQDLTNAFDQEMASLELEMQREPNAKELKKAKTKLWESLVAHKHKLSKEELADAKATLSVKDYAALEVASKNIKSSRKKQATGGGGDAFAKEKSLREVSPKMADSAMSPAEEAEAAEEAEISASTANVPTLLKKLSGLVKALGGKAPTAEQQAEIDEVAMAMAVPHVTKMFPKDNPTLREAKARALIPSMLKRVGASDTTIQKSQRAPSTWIMTPGQASQVMSTVIRALHAQGVDVIAIQNDIESAYEVVAKKYGFVIAESSKGKAIVGLVADWVTKGAPDTNTVLNAMHEAAHVFLQQSGMVSPEIFSAYQTAISEMPWENQNYITGPYATDLRILANAPRELLNADQLAILERATMQEIQDALSIDPTERVIENAVEHLTLWGIDETESRSLLDQVVRFVKDLALQFAIAIQKSLKGGQANKDLVKAFVENRWLQFINRDFAASNSALAISMREWIGAPTLLPERIPVYQNIDGEATNIMWNPQTGAAEYLPLTTETTDSVADRIKLALDRYNAEHGIFPIMKFQHALQQQWNELFDVAEKEATPLPQKQQAVKRMEGISVVLAGLGFNTSDRNMMTSRAIKSGEALQLSQRRNAGESLGIDGPEIEADTQIATINYELDAFKGLHTHPDVMRYLPVGTTMEEFLEDYVQLTPTKDPAKKKAKAIEAISAGLDAYGQPFAHNPNATISTLPTSVNGSSPQQAAVRDALISMNSVKELLLKRTEQARERLAELTDRKDNLTNAEKRELDKLNARIPMYERIMILKDFGIDDQIKRLEGKIGKAMLWDATPGAFYLVPPDANSPEEAVRRSTATIPASMSFDNNARQSFYQNIRKQTEWLRNQDNRNQGSIYGEMEIQNRKLLALSAEPIYTAQTWRLRNTYFDSLRNMLRGMGTPLAKFVGSRFDKLDAILLRWGNSAQVSGTKWARAYDDFKKSVNWKASDEDFKRLYWNRIISYAEDVPDGTTDPAGAVIRALTEISKFQLSADAKSKLRILLRATVENNSREAEILRTEMLKVQDDKLGEHAQRDIVRQGFITGRRTTSAQIDRVVQEMRPVWNSTEDVDFFGDLAERYNDDPSAVNVEASNYFTPTVVSSFVKPFIYHNRQYFKAPQQEGAVVRMASLANVREAFEAARGNMIQFARNLNQLEGGPVTGEAAYIQDTLGVFRGMYKKLQVISNARQASEQAGVETLPRQIMDAREASDFPPEFVNYSTYDPSANRTLLFQLGLNASFGRNGLTTGEFRKNLTAIEQELKGLHIQLSNLVQVEGKSKEEARKIMGDEKYYIALQARDHLQLLNRMTDKIAMVTRSSGSLMADIRLVDELVALNANMILQQPTAALTNTLDVLAPFYRLKLSTQAFAAMKNDMKTVARDVTGSILQEFGVHLLEESETNMRMRKLGLNDAESYLDWQDKMADYGPGGGLNTPSGVETIGHKIKRNSLLAVRRARQVTNLGVAEVADLATLRKFGVAPGAMKPGDKNIAPKFRVLGIFNMVGQALANGAVDGQYRNFKDMVTRGLTFIKDSADPDAVANRMLDGKIKLTPEDLGYNRKWFILNDQAAFDYMQNAIAEKMDEGSLERMVADAYLRMKIQPQAEVITDQQFVRIANLALTEFQLNSNFSNSPIDLKAGGGLWRILSPFLSWPYYAMLRVPSIFKDQNNQWKMKAAVDGAAVSLMAIVPLTMAASMMFDWFDEEIVGKRRNLRQATPEDAIPGYGLVNAPMATLERLGRYGAGGLLTEAVNSALNVDDARGGLTADNRILLFSQMKNFKDIVGNLWQEGIGNANYVSVMRPFAQFLGLGGVLQYQQILNKQLGLKNEEAGVNNRINIANYLRASGRDLDLDVRISRGPTSLPNQVTPYLQNMELAAYLDDMNMFRASFKRAVETYHQLHPDEPDAARQVIRSFQTRHPLKRVFTTLPSERNYRNLLDNLNPTGREAVTSGVRQFNRYLTLLGAKPVDAKDDTMNSVNQLRRFVMSNEAIREAQAIAAQAAYAGGF